MVMKIPSPGEIGLPEKFDKWRPVQEQALETIIQYHSKKRVKAICAPTGSGKSPLNVAAAILSNEPTCIVTQTKALQTQYMNDFESIGMVSLMGRNNYSCIMRDDYSCEEGSIGRCPYRGSMSCPSSAAEAKAATSKLVVTNYAKWIASKKYGQGMSHFTQVIFDEGHEMPNAIASAMQVVLHHKEIEDTLGIPFPSHNQAGDMNIWKPWAANAKAEAHKLLRELQAKIKGYSNPRSSWVREYNHMRNLIRRLSIIITANRDNWIVEEIYNAYQFDPIWPGKYAESTLLLRIPKIMIVSATLRIKTLHISGIVKGKTNKITRDAKGYEFKIETDNYIFEEYDTDFDPKDCPTYYLPTMRVDAKVKDLSMLWAKIDQWLARRQDRKGIIHTISYARKDDILSKSRFSSRMLFNTKGEPTIEMIELFKASPPGTIFVSPIINTGYDFPGIECEHTVMCKIPFEPPSKVVKAREEGDNEYRAYRAVQYMVQAFGRQNRFKGDRGEGIIFDSHMDWFWPRFRHLATRAFNNTFKTVHTMPEPLDKLPK